MTGPDVMLFDPYLTTLGGGERVMLTLAQALRPVAGRVTVAAPELPTEERLRHFGLPTDIELERVSLAALPEATRTRDGLVYLTNTIPRPSRARQSYLIVQFPFKRLPSAVRYRARRASLSILSKYRCITYSGFCREWLRRRWRQDSQILSPPVELGRYLPGAKKEMILSVGRFFPGGHTKRQDALIEAYGALPSRIRDRWKLVLVGSVGTDRPSQKYLARVRRAAATFENVEVQVNASQREVEARYLEASFFWHATGYQRPRSAPDRAEHFGISTVEAMSYGAVPLVYADGGQPEVVRGVGRTWRDLDDLVQQTVGLADDAALRRRVAERCTVASQAFAVDRFAQRARELIRFS